MKIVINKCYGGFGLSEKAVKLYCKLIRKKIFVWKDYRVTHYATVPKAKYDSFKTDDDRGATYFCERNIPRNDRNLIKVVEELGEKANGEHAYLKIIQIPDGIEWEIAEYDGMETVEEKHRSWG